MLGAVDVARSIWVLARSSGDRLGSALSQGTGRSSSVRSADQLCYSEQHPQGKTVISLAPDSDRRTSADAFGEPYFDVLRASPRFQSYRVTTSGPPSHGLILQGLCPEGVVLGA